MDKFFHLAPILLTPGSIILPGNYGRIIATGHSNNAEREQILESVRVGNYSDLPSRLASSFVIVEEKVALFYFQTLAQTCVPYLVEMTEPAAPQHCAQFNCLPPLPDRLNKTDEEVAHHYWRGDLLLPVQGYPDLVCVELLTLSPLRILERLSWRLNK